MSIEHSPIRSDHGVSSFGVKQRAAWSINDWCAEAGIGRVRCYAEINLGRIVAKKCGSRTLITTSPEDWLDSLPDLAEV